MLVLNTKSIHHTRFFAKPHNFALLVSPHIQHYRFSTDQPRKHDQLHRQELERQRMSNGFSPIAPGQPKMKTISSPRPSSSVLLISPHNHVLLLQRVKTSSSFASAHVFPGGNVSNSHDGELPSSDSPSHHIDNDTYRMAAIRETFEESGILLAHNKSTGRLVDLPEAKREEGRHSIHSNSLLFPEWLEQNDARADTDGLVPFTRWVTPTNVPKRFTTQMYLYLLPTSSSTSIAEGADESEAETKIPTPTSDGGKEHTAARFLPASVWLRLAQEGRIILFPPQFFLLHQVAQFLDGLSSPLAYGSISRAELPQEELEVRRKRLLQFVRTGDPPWTEMCISPTVLPPRGGKRREDGRSILGLHKPGPELTNTNRQGVQNQCVLVDFRKDGPRRLAVVSRADAIGSIDGVKL